MFNTFFAYFANPLIAGCVGVVVGTLLSTKIKDFVTGVPKDFRSAMSSVEAKAKADVKAATADVFAKIVPTPVKPAAPVAPVVVAPVTVAATGATGATGTK